MASILIFFYKQGKIFRETQIYGNNVKISKFFFIYKIFFLVVHNIQPLLQVPKYVNFRSPVTISRYGVTSLNEIALLYYRHSIVGIVATVWRRHPSNREMGRQCMLV
jgi:hypothetical protein